MNTVFSEHKYAHVGVERQTNNYTNIQTYIQTHTHFSEKNFSKPGTRPQWARTWSKNMEWAYVSALTKLIY